MNNAANRKLRIGVAGLGKAFGFMMPTLAHDPRVELVAAADPRPEARARFTSDFSGKAQEYLRFLPNDIVRGELSLI